MNHSIYREKLSIPNEMKSPSLFCVLLFLAPINSAIASQLHSRQTPQILIPCLFIIKQNGGLKSDRMQMNEVDP